MARFVLVHGAHGGAWCWDLVIGPLAAAGHTVEALDLPGSGDDRTPVAGVTLDAYVDRTSAVLEGRPEPAVLVGHSMGGAVIAQATARCPDRIASLVYVTAFAPLNGQSLLDLARLPEGESEEVPVDVVVEDGAPVVVMNAEVARWAVYGECTDEHAQWAIARRRPQAIAPLTSPVAVDDGALRRLPRAYVTCLEDRRIPYPLQRRMIADNGIEQVVELRADHSPFLSATDELVAALEGLA